MREAGEQSDLHHSPQRPVEGSYRNSDPRLIPHLTPDPFLGKETKRTFSGDF